MPQKLLTGQVAYFCAVIDGHVDVSFVINKTRLAPIKTLTIPRLELQGAVVASRLKSKISEEIDLRSMKHIFGLTLR